jgi:AraC family transcriptional regulator of arabinose operon
MELHDLLAHHESGHFRQRPAWWTDRPRPSDHLIIWVIRGGMEIAVSNARHSASAGDLVLLRPGQPHQYGPSTESGWEWLWLHFDGQAARVLMDRLRGPAGGPVRPFGTDEHIAGRFRELVTAAAPTALAPAPTVQLHLDSCAYSLLGLMVRKLETRPEDVSGSTTDLSYLTTWILDHLDQPFGLTDLVRTSGWSAAQLSRLTRRDLGMSPMQYATRLRMRHAQRLLRDSRLSVTAIAGMVGFDDPMHFSRRFRQLVGVPPTTYRSVAEQSVGAVG